MKSWLILGTFVLAVAAAIVFIRSRSPERLSTEDKVNLSGLAHRLCKAAAASSCPIEWRGKGEDHPHGSATLSPQTGMPVATLEQIRSVLVKPQWSESQRDGGWSFDSERYRVVVAPAGGPIVIFPR